jgi:hypothetical protein
LPTRTDGRKKGSKSVAKIEREMITLWYIDSTGRQLVKIYKDTPMSMPLVNFREIHPNTFSKTGSYSHRNTIKFEVPLIFDDDTPESVSCNIEFDYDLSTYHLV